MNQLRPLLIAIMVMALYSCSAAHFTIGMSESDFLAHNKRVKTITVSAAQSIYSRTNYPFGTPPVTTFFYFENGHLDHIDQGERQPDIIVEHR